MEESGKSTLTQPITFAGVAAFGYAGFGRLFAFQLGIASVAAAAVVWLFESAWAPVINRTILSLPHEGRIQGQLLIWPDSKPIRITGSPALSICIDPEDVLDPIPSSDLQVEVGHAELRLRSLFGYVSIPYPGGYMIAVNRSELEPWWGAWHPAVSVSLAALVLIGLLGTWLVLGLIYAWPIRLIAFYADRQLTWMGSVKLGAACLFPGAIFLILALIAYGLHQIRLVQLLLAVALHFLVGWAYLLAAPFCLDKEGSSPRRARPKKRLDTPQPKRKNPFSSPSQKAE